MRTASLPAAQRLLGAAVAGPKTNGLIGRCSGPLPPRKYPARRGAFPLCSAAVLALGLLGAAAAPRLMYADERGTKVYTNQGVLSAVGPLAFPPRRRAPSQDERSSKDERGTGRRRVHSRECLLPLTAWPAHCVGESEGPLHEMPFPGRKRDHSRECLLPLPVLPTAWVNCWSFHTTQEVSSSAR